MSFLGSLLAPMLPKLLDWIVAGFTKMGRYLWTKYESSSKISKEQREVDAQLERLKKALESGYDGKPLTKEQKREIDEAFAELVRGY